MTLLLIGLVNFIIGTFIGICGIAGFLLPIFYISIMGFQVSDAMALSFFAFVVSGLTGAWQYHKKRHLDIPFSLRIGLGSVTGALFGVLLAQYIPQETAKLLLYIVVLFSGASILFRLRKQASTNPYSPQLNNCLFVTLFGFVTAVICALSGAGGPVLVMPILTALGMPIHTAIGVALLDSVWIGFPAFIGHFYNSEQLNGYYFLVVLLSHGLGSLLGSRFASHINQNILKLSVGFFSIGIALYMLV